MNPKLLWRDSHCSQAFEIHESLKHHSSFKHEEHTETHETVVPIIIKEPQTGGEKLEYEKWHYQVFFVKGDEVRNWDRYLVWTID